MARRTLTIDNRTAAELAGSGDAVLRKLEERLDCDVFLRGNVITLDGDEAALADGQSMVEELVGLIERGEPLEASTVDSVSGAMSDGMEPSEMLGDAVWRHRGTRIAPRTPNQKRYVDAIRRETVTFGKYGPAGLSLARARELCIDAKRAISEGRSPAIEKQREKRRLKEAKSFGEFGEKWLETIQKKK